MRPDLICHLFSFFVALISLCVGMCCRTRVQGVPVHERASARPQPLSLPTPGPREAYHGDCAEYRPIPGGGPADKPASHWGEVIYAGDRQVNHDQEERMPPVEECAPPDVG